ncbi:MAG: hypothetical protein U0746_16145 [Gemmataceae bacterium]
MRKELILGIVVLAALAGRAPAQSSASTILGGASPQNLVNKPIDVSNVVVPTPAISAQQNRFNFSSLFSKLFLPGAQKVRGVSPLPSPSSFPTYKNYQMVGTPPFQLGGTKSNPIQPAMPVIPGTKSPVGPGS